MGVLKIFKAHRDMGLYDDRLADLSETRLNEARRARRVTSRRPAPEARGHTIGASSRKPMSTQSLLFSRSAGWTPSKAKSWAKSHGYKHGKVDVTDQYVRIRQADPKGFKVKRTVPFGEGIRAVVAREESMSTTRKSSRRSHKKKSSRKRSKRRAHKRPSRKRARKVRVEAHRPRRKRSKAVRRRRRVRAATVVATPMVAAPRRRRRRRRRVSHAKAWRGDAAGHARAARKGHRRKKRRGGKRRSHRRRRSRARETTQVMETPRRRRRRRRSHVMAPRRRRRRGHRRMHASRSGGMGIAEVLLGIGFGGAGFILADGLDRFLATYDPSSTAAKPTDKFTSDGTGTLANTLNVASAPSWVRIGAGVGMVAVPAAGAYYVRNPLARSAFEGATLGAGISLLKTVWNTFVMPMLIGKDTSPPTLQKSFIARLYPAEVAAHINRAQTPPQTAVSSAGSGALSGPPDVGPFALAGDSAYPDAAQALRAQAGMQDQFPSMQNIWGTGGPGSDYPTAAQVMGTGAGPGPSGASYAPGPPPGPGPGPQAHPHQDCGCVGDNHPFLGFIGDKLEEDSFAAN